MSEQGRPRSMGDLVNQKIERQRAMQARMDKGTGPLPYSQEDYETIRDWDSRLEKPLSLQERLEIDTDLLVQDTMRQMSREREAAKKAGLQGAPSGSGAASSRRSPTELLQDQFRSIEEADRSRASAVQRGLEQAEQIEGAAQPQQDGRELG